MSVGRTAGWRKWREVRQNCQQWAGPYVLAHHLVIAPAPDLMALIPEAMRYELVRETTERVIEQWHLERGLNVPEYSYCLHDRDTRDEGLQNLHTHVFIAGTIENDLASVSRIGSSESRLSPMPGRWNGQTICTTLHDRSLKVCSTGRWAKRGAWSAKRCRNKNRNIAPPI